MNAPGKILLTGAGGQVGHELRRSLMPLGEVVAPTRQELDLNDPAAISAMVEVVSPQTIVNAAAYTAVDAAEANETDAMRVNAEAVKTLAAAACRINALVVHYSTDYVFDGTKPRPYVETDPVNPLGAYGRSKLAGEEALREAGCDHLIFRTSWVYAARGRNFLRTILRLADEREELNIVNDQYGAPTWARNIADVTAQILHQQRTIGTAGHLSGTFHLVASGETTWCGFAQAILDAKLGSSTTKCKIIPITSDEYPTPALRPKNSRLDCAALTRRFGLALPDWKVGLHRCLEDANL
jgi:dTDP-4-dehydrorhamnose reductase